MVNCTKNAGRKLVGLVIMTNIGRHMCERPGENYVNHTKNYTKTAHFHSNGRFFSIFRLSFCD